MRLVRAPHDAEEHVALVVTVNSSGERVGIAYDIGHVTERFAAQFADVDVLLLESNHDDRMLATGPYPWSVKQRVAGPRGHLSNAEAGLMARACIHPGLRHLVLCHLSETNNRPQLALRAMRTSLRGSGFCGTLRAAVFGVNDGLVSNASLILGVAGATSESSMILLSGVAGLLAGAFSMAAGEYISMRSQREMFEYQIGMERAELEQ